MNISPQIDLEPTLGSKISLLEAFGAMQKYHRFLVPFLRPKNREKLAREAARWCQRAPRVRRGCRSVGSRPQGGHARDQDNS